MSLWTVKECAAYLRVHPHMIYKLAKEQQMPALKVGRHWRFDQEQIEQWVKAGGCYVIGAGRTG